MSSFASPGNFLNFSALIVFSLAILVVPASGAGGKSPFVKTSGLNFIRYGKKYTFIGTNLWYGMNLAASDRGRLVRELDHLARLGIKNIRVLAASEGPDSEPWRIVPAVQATPGAVNEKLLIGLDFLLAEMRRRGMTAVIMLGNYWHWSGGFGQYLVWAGKGPIPYPKFDAEALGGNGQGAKSFFMWLRYNFFVTQFYATPAATELYERFIRKIVARRNTITGGTYANDPTIMAWQLANEPAGAFNSEAYDVWIQKSAKLIKSLDKNHLVSTGAMGEVFSFSGVSHIRNNSHKEIDYATVHIWVQNAGIYNPADAANTYPKALANMQELLQKHREFSRQLKKPLVFEEFGISRDANSLTPHTAVSVRDQFYRAAFDQVIHSQESDTPVAGVNFWAWGGEAVPAHIQWQPGDPWIGDPPHEAQGWYSVFLSDKTTLQVITDAVKRLGAATRQR